MLNIYPLSSLCSEVHQNFLEILPEQATMDNMEINIRAFKKVFQSEKVYFSIHSLTPVPSKHCWKFFTWPSFQVLRHRVKLSVLFANNILISLMAPNQFPLILSPIYFVLVMCLSGCLQIWQGNYLLYSYEQANPQL